MTLFHLFGRSWSRPMSFVRMLSHKKIDNDYMKSIRNIGIIAHIDSGKTTVTERMLFYSGVIRRPGDVDRGDTTMDYMQQERERGITIQSAAITVPWNDHRINLIDTPGHVDFTVEVERSVRVLDGAVAILDAVAGVQAQTRTVWSQANRYKVPRLVFVNKLDRDGADLYKAVNSLKMRLKVEPLILQMPVVCNGQIDAIVDLVSLQVHRWTDKLGLENVVTQIPHSSKDFSRDTAEALSKNEKEKENENENENENTKKYMEIEKDKDIIERALKERQVLLEQLANLDEGMMDAFLQETIQDMGELDIKAAIRRVSLSRAGVCVLCGSALRNRGVQLLLDGVIDYLPSPLDSSPFQVFIEKTKTEQAIVPDPHGELCALAFKVLHDRQRGPLVYIRVYSGTLESRNSVHNVNEGKKERATKLLQIQANTLIEVESVECGNICAASGFRFTSTGDTLLASTPRKMMRLPGVSVPSPVYTCAVEAASSLEQEALETALDVMRREDPSMSVWNDKESGQTLVSGMGELHLDIIRDRLVRDFGVNATMGRMQISYRESPTTIAEETYTFDRILNGKPAYAQLHLRISPVRDPYEDPAEGEGGSNARQENQEGTEANRIEWNVDDDSMAKELHPHTMAIEHGIRSGLQRGPLKGFPMVNTRVEILGGSGGSDAAAWRGCASMGLRHAMGRCSAVGLEPVMDVEISGEQRHIGAIVAEITGHRRGWIDGVDADSGGSEEIRVIRAQIPLSSMGDYATHLRSSTQGRASYAMRFCRYTPVTMAEMDA